MHTGSAGLTDALSFTGESEKYGGAEPMLQFGFAGVLLQIFVPSRDESSKQKGSATGARRSAPLWYKRYGTVTGIWRPLASLAACKK